MENEAMSDDLLRGQLDYYRARAREYDASMDPVTSDPEALTAEAQEWAGLVRAVRSLGPLGSVLELAAGTGIWTQELHSLATELTVVDGSQEMLDINRGKIADPRVRYECIDLFAWEPAEQYDLVFFAFWLSHVPPDRMGLFLDRVRRSVKPAGRVFIVDEPAEGHQLSGPNQDGMYQQRSVADGRQFRIVKVYSRPEEIQEELRARGFAPAGQMLGDYFFWLKGRLPE